MGTRRSGPKRTEADRSGPKWTEVEVLVVIFRLEYLAPERAREDASQRPIELLSARRRCSCGGRGFERPPEGAPPLALVVVVMV